MMMMIIIIIIIMIIVKILGLILAATRNRPGASAVGVRDHNQHATHQCCVQNYCYFYIPIRAEDAVNLSSKLVIKMEEKIKQKQDGCGMGENENGMRCGKHK